MSPGTEIEIFENRPAVDVRRDEYLRLLGYPRGHEPDERADELARQSREWYATHGRPYFFARSMRGTATKKGVVTIGGEEFVSHRLADAMEVSHADTVVLVAVSAGRQCELEARRLWEEERPDEYFFLEVYGSAVVEHLVVSAGYRLCAWGDEIGVAILPHQSPGYPGWDIRDQERLLALIRSPGGRETLPEELEVLDSGMLSPKKSLLAAFPVTKHVDGISRLTDLIPCERCSLQGCRYRRSPQRVPLPQLEDVSALHARVGEILGDPSPSSTFSYITGKKALQKWAGERLRLTRGADRSIEATFRYDGTTCSNMGRPLAFEYRLTLEGTGTGFVVRRATCKPVVGDVGHTLMCEYLRDPEGLMEGIMTDGPAENVMLEEAMQRGTTFSPAGCYCDASSRAHKWRIVLEVIHFALTQRIVTIP